MQLLDGDDPFESGLEILARPPGKRNQTIGPLSGGEKTRSAVALLISVFRYKAEHSCILHEVDVQLDEASIDRFTALLLELPEETPFVLITPSRRTMEAARELSGVTQEEPGISKIVSVRFDRRPGSGAPRARPGGGSVGSPSPGPPRGEVPR